MTRTHTLSLGVGAIALGLSLAACGASEGAAVGELEHPSGKPEATVALYWKASAADPTMGEIAGTLPSGVHYKGRYFEVTAEARADDYDYAWDGWSPFWTDWPWGDGYVDSDWPTFIKIYTGRVIANLEGPKPGQRMRCRFNLTEPAQGLAGGGSGQCQLTGGDTINDVVLTQR